MKQYIRIKKTIDFAFALLMIIIVSPIMLLTVIFIKLDSKGPVLFIQKRPGKDGKVFLVYKFRTMKVENEKDGRLLFDKERITKLGAILRKTSIDELPQLFNILRGEMSFIGPRPLLEGYLKLYSPEQMRRHEVLPGITGWAQVNGRNTISWAKKFEYDVWYVDNMNIIQDIKILGMTIHRVIFGKDVDQDETDTQEVFKGN